MLPYAKAAGRSAAPPTSTRVDVLEGSADAANAASGSATASVLYNTAGQCTYTANPTGTKSANYTWRLTGASADYQVMFSNLVGDTPSGQSFDTWLTLNTNRQLNLTAAVNTAAGCSFRVTIRDASTLEILEYATVTLSASGGTN